MADEAVADEAVRVDEDDEDNENDKAGGETTAPVQSPKPI